MSLTGISNCRSSTLRRSYRTKPSGRLASTRCCFGFVNMLQNDSILLRRHHRIRSSNSGISASSPSGLRRFLFLTNKLVFSGFCLIQVFLLRPTRSLSLTTLSTIRYFDRRPKGHPRLLASDMPETLCSIVD